MKKLYKFDDMSDQLCTNTDCNKPLKKNVVERKETAGPCFECYRKAGKCPTITAREARTGKVFGKKKGVYGMPD